MKVLNWTFSPKFEKIFTDALAFSKSIEFRPMSLHPNKYFHQYNGLKSTENGNNVIYLKVTVDEKEIEQIAAHELGHLIADAQGFKISSRINEKKLLNLLTKNYGKTEGKNKFKKTLQMITTRFAFIKSTFSDIFSDLHLKNYGYDISAGRQKTEDTVREDLIDLNLKDKEKVFLCAIIFVVAKYREGLTCAVIKPSYLKKLYRKYGRNLVLKTAKDIMKKLPDGDISKPQDYFRIIKKIRDLYMETFGISGGNTFLELKNPTTCEVE